MCILWHEDDNSHFRERLLSDIFNALISRLNVYRATLLRHWSRGGASQNATKHLDAVSGASCNTALDTGVRR